jgi:hypothetical protein
MKRARISVQDTFIKAGGLSHSRYPVTTADAYDKLHAEFVAQAMDLIASYIGRLAAPKQLAEWARPHLEWLTNSALNEIPEAMGVKSALQQKYRPLLEERVDGALRDLAIGMVNGKVVQGVTPASLPLLAVNPTSYVDPGRISALASITSPDFDLRKLVRLCEELNASWTIGNYFAVAALLRAVMDHVPPIFSVRSFDQVIAQHGGRSFKDQMTYLESSSRKIADSSLHGQIRKSESLPTPVQVNFAPSLDVLLGEVVAKLS